MKLAQNSPHLPRQRLPLRAISILAASLLFVEGCASTKQFKAEHGNSQSMGNGRMELVRPDMEGKDSLKVVPKPLTPEGKMKARLKEIDKALDSINTEVYKRFQIGAENLPKLDSWKLMIDSFFLNFEQDLYKSALNHDQKGVEKAKMDIEKVGEKTGQENRAREILSQFERNSK